jgi:hypothetical protein
VPYKQVFGKLYSGDSLGAASAAEAIALLPDGRLNIQLGGKSEIVNLGVAHPVASSLIMAGDQPYQFAATPDGRYSVEINTFPHENITEYWLIHTDQANGKFKRAKLTSEWKSDDAVTQPRVTASPDSSFFIADDGGTIRLYSAAHFIEAGTFQIAHTNTGNRVLALAISADGRLIAGLSSWKDIVLYNIAERKVAFVRQIRDSVGWYDPSQAFILIAGDAEAIVTLGISQKADSDGKSYLSLNGFQFITLNVVSV